MRTFYFETAGQGDPLLFLHGFGGNGQRWSAQVGHFAPSRRVITIDLPGHGKTPWNGEGLDEMAVGVEEVLRHNGIERAGFVASSFGGLVALSLYARAPERFERLTLVGACPKFTTQTGYPAGLDSARIQKLSRQLEGDPAAVLEMFFRSLFTMQERESERWIWIKDQARTSPLPDLRALLAFLKILDTADLRPVFQGLRIPVQWIVGAEDPICPVALLALVQTALPSARVDVMPRCGHLPFLSQPDTINKLLETFHEVR